MELSHSVRALLPLKSLIKEVIYNLGIDSEKLNFVPSSTIYEENNGAIFVAKIPTMNPTSKNIAVKYHWFRQHVGKEFVVQKIESENQKSDIFTKGLQGQISVRITSLSDEDGALLFPSSANFSRSFQKLKLIDCKV